MMTDKYIYVQSDESNDYFPDNHMYRFKVHLNTPMSLKGFWKVALVEFHVQGKATGGVLYVYTNMCKESIVHGEEKTLLRRLEKNKKSEWNYLFDTPFYLPVEKKELREFEIYIKLKDGTYATQLTSPVNATLHLKRYPFFGDYGSL